MRIDSFVYQELIKDFILMVWDTELTEAQKTSFKRGDEQIWDCEQPGVKGDNFFERIFTARNKFIVRNHFTRKPNEHPGAPTLPINWMYLLDMLKYIGVNPPASADRKALRIERKKAKILYEEYEKEVYKRVEKESLNTENISEVASLPLNEIALQTLNKVSTQLQVLNLKNPNLEQENKDFLYQLKEFLDGEAFKAEKIEPVLTEEKKVELLVYDFHRFLTSERLPEAWNLLTDEYKFSDWGNVYKDFEVGYKNVIAINGKHVWDVKVEGEQAECKIFFIDKMHTRSDRILGNIEMLPLSQFKEYVTAIETLIERAAVLKIPGFEKLEIYQFFDPSVSERIWYNCGRNPDVIKDLLPLPRHDCQVPRLSSVSCIFQRNEGWRISDISTIRTYR